MTMQFTSQANTAPGRAPRQVNAWLWLVAGAAAVAAIALAGLPALAGSFSGTAPHGYWYISRACAFVAFGLLWLSMLAGLGITSRLARYWPSLPGSFELHRFTALLGLGFAAMHALVLLGDQYINYSVGQLLVPFMSSNYRQAWVGFGQLAIYLLAAVAFSFYVKDRLGIHAWRLIHMLSFALFLMTIIHGLGSGTDSGSLWAQALYWGSALSVLGLSVYRVVAVRRGRAKADRGTANLVATGGRPPAPPAGAVADAPARLVRPGVLVPSGSPYAGRGRAPRVSPDR
jgi:predicted ferric reductase